MLLAVLLLGAAFRFIGLGYSEFQGDETLVMVLAAEALEGQPNALFLENNKGPGQILLPMTLWRLTGTINEFSARLPFALAGLLALITIYLSGRTFLNEKSGLFAAAFMALTGLMVALSRIVQYQQVVILMSCLALLCAWQWRQAGQLRWAILAGIFEGTGILFHYDIVMVAPALLYIIISKPQSKLDGLKTLFIIGGSLVVVAGFFFGPYLLSPQAVHTGGYLSRRIGQELLKNKLPNFFHVATLYNSSYYAIITGLLVVAFFTWALSGFTRVKRLPLIRYIIPLIIIGVTLALSIWPAALRVAGIDFAFVPFAVIFGAAFLSPALGVGQRIVIAWLAATFLAYNFAIVDPGTHIYTIFPAWVLLAGQSVAWLDELVTRHNYTRCALLGGGALLVILLGNYDYIAFLRQDVEFKAGWPDTKSAFYWDPYTNLPQPDHSFGFVHKEGWKAIGGLYLTNQLTGEYQTNGKYGSADWYTRHQLRGCYNQSKQFFALKNTVIDSVAFADYKVAVELTLPYSRGMTIYQLHPLTNGLNSLVVDDLQNNFDHTAYPAVFVRPAHQNYPVAANLYNVIELTGYELTPANIQPGNSMAITLYWHALKAVSVDLHVFVHLVNADEPGVSNIWAQSNGSPACNQQPTSTWQPGQTIKDMHIIPISPNIPPGNYLLVAGMYLPGDNTRLPLVDKNGNPTAENTIKLTTISVK